MNIQLTRIPPYQGIYGIDGKQLGKQQRLLNTDAAVSLALVERDSGVGLVYSDVFRTAQGSLDAISRKTGVQPPAYSGHNFGFCVDVAVEATLKKCSMSYSDLLLFMAKHDWYCHRRDNNTGSESWHFNHFTLKEASEYLPLANTKNRATWSKPIEAKILSFYGSEFKLDPLEVQVSLAKLSLYGGPLNGNLADENVINAIKSFQRAWKINVDGDPGIVTQRTLAYVCAKLVIDEV